MSRTKHISKFGTVLCAIALILWFAAGLLLVKPAFAEETTGSLTLWCVKDEDIVVGMHWQIYRVGHREADDYVFEGDFENYRATLGDQSKPMLEWDTDTVAAAGEALKYKAIVDKIEPDDDDYTNGAGAVAFSGLENGLYLVWGDILKVGDTTYIPSAIFFEVNGEENLLNAYPKIVLRTLNAGFANYSVRKVWQNDEDQPWNRGVSITVERYRDNEYYDEIALSDANDWKYEWEDSDDHTWFVYEKIIPAGYTVSYKENHTQYLIINTFEGFTDDSSMTDIQTTKVTDDNHTDVNTTTTKSTDDNHTETTSLNTTAENTTDERNTTGDRNTTKSTTRTTTSTQTTTVQTSADEKAPQTGQLWWPVPGMAAGGLLLFGMGLKITKKDDDEEN